MCKIWISWFYLCTYTYTELGPEKLLPKCEALYLRIYTKKIIQIPRCNRGGWRLFWQRANLSWNHNICVTFPWKPGMQCNIFQTFFKNPGSFPYNALRPLYPLSFIKKDNDLR